MPDTPTWEFPKEQPNSEGHGFHDAGIAHFSSNRNNALFRECLQNSLDADDASKGVMVNIELEQLPAEFLDSTSLEKHLQLSCKSDWAKDGRQELEGAIEILQGKMIPTLSITDVDTLGASDEASDDSNISPWMAMTNSVGHSAKRDKALGAFGLGKHAPFAATPLRTVLYSTCYRNLEGNLEQRFIGRSILVTHFDENDQQYSAKGYLGNECEPLRDKEIPNRFLLSTTGTMVLVPGYSDKEDDEGRTWEVRALNAAAENFFFSLVHGRLELTIGNNLAIDKESIQKGGDCWKLISDDKTRKYIEVAAQDPKASCYINGIGDVEIRIDVSEKNMGHDRRALALVRDPGLMITDSASRLGPANPAIPHEWNPFTAVVACVPRGQDENTGFEGDWVLRACEPASHDRLSIDEISEADNKRRKEARKALEELKKWLLEIIGEHARPSYSKTSDEASELEDVGLVISDPASGEDLILTPPEKLNRAPKDERMTIEGQTEEDTEEESDDGEDGIIEDSGEGEDGDQSGTKVKDGKTKVVKRNRHALQEIFSQVYNEEMEIETHKVSVSFAPPKIKRDQELKLELQVVGEDERNYGTTIREAKCASTDLTFSKNLFDIPSELIVQDSRLKVDLTLSEPVESMTFRLRYGFQKSMI